MTTCENCSFFFSWLESHSVVQGGLKLMACSWLLSAEIYKHEPSYLAKTVNRKQYQLVRDALDNL